MWTIRISEEVWEAIAAEGKFGETEDDVLRRILHLDPAPAISARAGRGSRRYASQRMSARVQHNKLIVEFQDGTKETWTLAAKTDRNAIRRIRDQAVGFARDHGASDPGQINAVKKALTANGYHVVGPRIRLNDPENWVADENCTPRHAIGSGNLPQSKR